MFIEIFGGIILTLITLITFCSTESIFYVDEKDEVVS